MDIIERRSWEIGARGFGGLGSLRGLLGTRRCDLRYGWRLWSRSRSGRRECRAILKTLDRCAVVIDSIRDHGTVCIGNRNGTLARSIGWRDAIVGTDAISWAWRADRRLSLSPQTGTLDQVLLLAAGVLRPDLLAVDTLY